MKTNSHNCIRATVVVLFVILPLLQVPQASSLPMTSANHSDQETASIPSMTILRTVLNQSIHSIDTVKKDKVYSQTTSNFNTSTSKTSTDSSVSAGSLAGFIIVGLLLCCCSSALGHRKVTGHWVFVRH